MNEEQLANALSAHIDAMLAGQPMPVEDRPEELRGLLSLADQLVASDLPPRPAFGQRLKRSLMGRQGGGNGGPGGSGGRPWLAILGLVAVMGVVGMGAITANLAVRHLLLQSDSLPTSIPAVPSPLTTLEPSSMPVTPSPTPTAETTPVDTVQPGPGSATDRLLPTATPTPSFPLNLVPHPARGDKHRSCCGDSDDDDEDD